MTFSRLRATIKSTQAVKEVVKLTINLQLCHVSLQFLWLWLNQTKNILMTISEFQTFIVMEVYKIAKENHRSSFNNFKTLDKKE